MNAAIEGLNGEEFAGSALIINEARPREERLLGVGDRGGDRSCRDNYWLTTQLQNPTDSQKSYSCGILEMLPFYRWVLA